MKKYLGGLLALSLVLTGCGAAGTELQTTVKETETIMETQLPPMEASVPLQIAEPVEGAYDLFEEGAVDDSFTFQWSSEAGERNIQRYVSEELLPEYVDRWFEDGQILEDHTAWTLADGVAGWILISGTPRQDLGWNSMEKEGKTVYCRNILVQHIPHSQEFQFLKTTPSPDLLQPEPVEDIDHEFFGIEDQGLALPAIRSAELYVKSLSKCYRLEDPESLSLLCRGLSLPPQVRMQTFAASLEPEGVGDVLVLDLEGQGKRMVLTEPEGGPGSDIWSGHLLLMPRSLYELFGVPLASKGYGPLGEKGRTLEIERLREGIPYPLRYRYELDANGNLKEFEDITDRQEDAFRGPAREHYTYDEENRMLTHESDYGDQTSKNIYTYDDQGRLTEEVRRAGQEGQERRIYSYDGQDRILSRILVDEKGEEIPGSGVYFWYDENGGRHGFWYLQNGEAGGDPPEAPLRRPN